MSQSPRPLIEVLAEIPDVRRARGKRHSLVAILSLVCAATLCGYRSYGAMAEWGHNYGSDLLAALGFTRGTSPCAATLYRVLSTLDLTAVEAALNGWAEGVLAALPPDPTEPEGIALDGKTLRGSRKQGALCPHLLSAVSHRLGLTLRHAAVEAKTNEIGAVGALLQDLVVEGRIYTMDALLTQRAVAATLVAAGGAYVMVVKDNHPRWCADIAAVFADPALLAEAGPPAETCDYGHGRIERRRLWTSTALVGYSDWPGLQQVFRLDRRRIFVRTGEVQHETIYGATCLSPHRADARCLLGLVRAHWCIENKSHWVRDVTFDEDRSQVRCGATPHVLAAIRTTTIGLLRCAGETNIAAACRRLAAQPEAALALIGLASTMK